MTAGTLAGWGGLLQHPGWIAAAAAAVFASGVLRGFSGFGSSLFSVPILSLMFAPAAVAPVMMGVQFLTGLQTLRSDRRAIAWPSVVPLAAAGSLAAVGGAGFLVSISADFARLLMGLVVLATVAVLISGWRYARMPRMGLSAGVGAASGLLNGFAAMGGPPLVVYFLGGPFAPATARASMTFVFMVQGLVSLGSLAVLGAVSRGTLLAVAAVFPLMGLGTAVGTALFRRWGASHYRRACTGTLLLLALSLIARSVWAL